MKSTTTKISPDFRSDLANTVLPRMCVCQNSGDDGNIALLFGDVFCSAQSRAVSKKRQRGVDLCIGQRHMKT